MPGPVDPHILRKISRYPVRRYLASGGMSWVFEVEDEVLGVTRALKLLKPEAAGGEDLQRFANEARIIARFEHPNLLTVYDFGRDEGTGCFYYTMNLVEGTTFSDIEVGVGDDADATRHKEIRCGVLEVAGYFVQVLDALARLHTGGIIHRDIKPGNIFLHRDRFSEIRPMLGDLGVARIEGGGSDLTHAGYTIGTPLYMSPEQLRASAVSPASDVFSFGLTMYRVLTGHTVYERMKGVDAASAPSVMASLGALLMSGKEFEFQFPAFVPEPLRRVIQRACRMKPRERYPDAHGLRAALEDACAALATVAARSEIDEHPWAIGFALVIALAALIAGSWLWHQHRAAALATRVASQIARVRGQRDDALAALEAIEHFPARPQALVDDTHLGLSEVDQNLDAAQLLLAAGQPTDASTKQERASVELDRLCGRLHGAFLGQAVSPGTEVHRQEERSESAGTKPGELGQQEGGNASSLENAQPNDECAAARALAGTIDRTAIARPPPQQPGIPKEQKSAELRPPGSGSSGGARLPPPTKAQTRREDGTPSALAYGGEERPSGEPSRKPEISPMSRDQQVRSLVTHWCSAVNREELVGFETQMELSDELRATFDKRKAGFDEQRCKSPSIAQDGDGYRVDVPVEQIQKDGDMSNVKRKFIARMSVKPDAGGWRIERIDLPDH